MKFDMQFFKILCASEKRITVATMVTMLRILLSPVIVYFMMLDQWWCAFITFVIAAATDAIDGNLARAWNDKTVFGACLDPIADKIFLISCFASLAFMPLPLFTVPQWFVTLIVIKELIILIGAFLLFKIGCAFTPQPTILGKATTVMDVSFIIWLFLAQLFSVTPMLSMCHTFINCMASITIISCLQYVWIGIRLLSSSMVKL